MLSVSEAELHLSRLIAMARAAGADAADALFVVDTSTQVAVRLGKLEDVSRSEGADIGLRVFVGRRSASVSSSDLSEDALRVLAERGVAMAREAPEDPFAGLAPEDRLAGAAPDLELDDGGTASPAALRERALEAEDAARSVAGVSNSEGAGASASRTAIVLATSAGFARGYATSAYSCSASVLAGSGGGMQRDHASRSARHLTDLEGAAAIGRRAGERAVARLDPVKLPSGTMPLVYDRRIGASLLGHLVGAITGSAITRRTSFLLDALGEAVFAPGVSVVDDPLRPRGLRSKPFDGEGLPTARTTLIDRGTLTGWLLESASARQLGLQPTGHASRGIGGAPGAGATNLYMAAGSVTPAALMADIDRGVLITELIGQGVNPITGDYSRGASGFLIEGGEVTRPVAEITVAGNMRDMFRALVPADDLVFERAVDVPSFRIDGMTVAGA